MIIGNRQINFPAVDVPEISRWEIEMIFNDYFKSLTQRLLETLSVKFQYASEDLFLDSIKQTLHFLILLGATKELPEDIGLVEKIELWKEFIQLEPISEGIAIQLQTMLTKHHFPEMYKNISKGHVYAHNSLTMIKEAVLYTMEYLQKNDLLKSDKELLERENIENWLTQSCSNQKVPVSAIDGKPIPPEAIEGLQDAIVDVKNGDFEVCSKTSEVKENE